MTEEKKDQRVKAPVLRAKYKSRTLDEFIEKYSRDISRSGMWIKSPKPPALGTLLKVEILLEDGSPVISAVGRVVKRREESEAGVDNPAGMGIRFLKVEEASQPTIDRIVALKGEDAGPHFDNIRTGQTVPPPSPAAEHSPFFGAAGPAAGAPAESDRTMMRQMNALLGEALRQVNESAPRRDLPAQKATIMGVAAPAGMLQQAIASGREGERKADEGPTKVATRSEIDNALEKLKTVEDDRKSEPAKAEPAKAEAPKAEPAKAEAPKAEPVKAEPAKAEPAAKLESPRPEPVKSEPPKAESPKLSAVKSEAPKPPALKVEDKKNDSDRSASRSVPPRALRGPSVPPTPASAARSSSPEASTPPVEAKAEPTPAPAPERKSEPALKAEAKPVEPPTTPAAPEAKVEPAAAPVSLEKAPEEPKAEEPKAEAPAAPVSLDKKPDEAKAEEPKAEEPKAEEPKAEPAAAVVSLDKKPEEAKVEEKKPDAPKTDAKAEEKAVAKVEEKKAPEAKKEPEKKPSTPPQPEGSATGLIVAIVVIAALAFAVYKFLLSS